MIRTLSAKWQAHYGISALFALAFFWTGFIMDQSRYPMYFHAWTQADQYALALGFERNGLDFFHPQTFVLNPQFPDNWELPRETAVTAVDFPIHSYIPAVLMKILGTRDVAVFRWYVLFMFFLGAFFLWRLARVHGLTSGLSLLITIFMSSLPVFVYYANAPLVTIPTLTCAWIGMYYWSAFRIIGHQRHGWMAIFWLTLAALSRSTFLIPLLAVFGAEAWLMVKQRKVSVRFVIGVLLSLLAIAAFAVHNHRLRDAFGSAFLSELMPPSGWTEGLELTGIILKRWLLDWFSWIHLAVVAVLLIGVVWQRLKVGEKPKRDIFGVAITLMFLGAMAFYVAMMRQFADHDYYFLDAFALPLGLFLIALVKRLSRIWMLMGRWRSVLVIFYFTLPISALRLTNERNMDVPWDRVSATVRNFSGSDKILDQMGISRKARILVIDAYAPNIPLTLADRMGYVVMTTSRTNMERALGWPYEIGIYQNEWLESDILHEWPGFSEHIEELKKTDKLTFFRPKKH